MHDDARSEIMSQIAVGAPFLHNLAASRLLNINAFNREEQAELLEVVDKWLRTFRAISYNYQQVVRTVLPAVEQLRTELAGPYQTEQDEFESAFNGVIREIQEAAPGFNPDAQPKLKPNRPSHVPVPGPLDDALPVFKLRSEDELRAQILLWRSPGIKGLRSVSPLFSVDGKPCFPFGVRERLYVGRKIERPWVTTVKWDCDNAIAEDFCLIMAFLRGKLTCVSRTAISSALEPYVRKWNSWGCYLACRRAVEKLERDGALLHPSGRTWVPSPKGIEAAKLLLKLWLAPAEEDSSR